jgi:hypothetical protein
MGAVLSAHRPARRLSLGFAAPLTNKFVPEEEAEIELMLWEYDRDGKIAIDNFFRREPELAWRMVSGVIPKRVRQDLIAFLKQREFGGPRGEAEEKGSGVL